jgi:hypothetical protein
MHWIDLAQNRNQWRALVNMIMNLQVPENVRKFLSSDWQLLKNASAPGSELHFYLSNCQLLKKESAPLSWPNMVSP